MTYLDSDYEALHLDSDYEEPVTLHYDEAVVTEVLKQFEDMKKQEELKLMYKIIEAFHYNDIERVYELQSSFQ